jgi:hypothetical protein
MEDSRTRWVAEGCEQFRDPRRAVGAKRAPEERSNRIRVKAGYLALIGVDRRGKHLSEHSTMVPNHRRSAVMRSGRGAPYGYAGPARGRRLLLLKDDEVGRHRHRFGEDVADRRRVLDVLTESWS